MAGLPWRFTSSGLSVVKGASWEKNNKKENEIKGARPRREAPGDDTNVTFAAFAYQLPMAAGLALMHCQRVSSHCPGLVCRSIATL